MFSCFFGNILLTKLQVEPEPFPAVQPEVGPPTYLLFSLPPSTETPPTIGIRDTLGHQLEPGGGGLKNHKCGKHTLNVRSALLSTHYITSSLLVYLHTIIIYRITIKFQGT